MGCFQVDTNLLSENYRFQVPVNGRMALTPCGIFALGRSGVFITIDPQQIGDKSQVDVFSKGLTLIQVSWMAIQAIARKLSGLPLSLLELHTLVHAICALAMYFFWFNKPAGVRDPTIVDEAIGNLLFGTGGSVNRMACKHPLSEATQPRINHFLTARLSNARGTPDTYDKRGYLYKALILIQLASIIVFGAYGGVHMTA
ncbi:hypothetical protein K440DRAFT_642077 [Wilcoxina mikolae CBS 423.85]|nr:hypothetical protein K440DRAFT_642077 [Wilcoxina mikolae CBS 423.85]